MPVKVNLYEKAIQPVVDLDGDVVVYVPGYALKGPSEPTIVTSSNFTALFGDSPYTFKTNQSATVAKNNVYRGRPEKGWLYAKGLVDAGLTVLYHRVNPCEIGKAENFDGLPLLSGPLQAGKGVKLVLKSASGTSKKAKSVEESDEDKLATAEAELYEDVKLYIRAKYFGSYYSSLTVKISQSDPLKGNTTIEVLRGTTVLESQVVSFDPSRNNFIGNATFNYVDFFVKLVFGATEDIEEEEPLDDGAEKLAESLREVTEDYFGFDTLGLEEFYSDNADKAVYIKEGIYGLSMPENTSAEEFDVDKFMKLFEGNKSPLYELEDTDRYQSVTYLTSGGYYQTEAAAGLMQKIAFSIKSIALVDLPDVVTAETFSGLQTKLAALSSTVEEKAKSAMYYGADTYVLSGKTVVMPDSYGYLAKLGSNLAQAIPAWIPVANNPQGVVAAVATTRPILNSLREMMINEDGVSVNPIVYKQNVGYTIMGNRTLKPVDGVTGPDSFLNCQLVVNSVLRSARRAANALLVVSTNANEAFSTFRSTVSKTCEKMMLNGDGLLAYSIKKLKKTKPATIDVAIDLTVVEGIETFNVNLSYALQLDV